MAEGEANQIDPGLAPRRSPMANLVPRIISASVLVPIALVAVWYGGWALLGLVFIANLLMMHEWFALTGSTNRLVESVCAIVLGLVLYAASAGQLIEAVVILTGGAVLARGLSGREQPSLPPGWGLVYVGLPSLLLLDIRGHASSGLAELVWLLVVVWALDIGAYFSGKFIGGPKLAPRLSPNKTWAGLIGGVVLSMVVGVVSMIGLVDWLGIPFWPDTAILAAGLAALLSVVAQLGDIGESLLKRRAGVKDAGSIIPGHGGVLDRVDGLMAAVPVFWLGLALIGRPL